jgi:uncharacterized protein (UPF0332 family)
VTGDNTARHVAAEWARARSLRDAAGKELAAGIFERAAATLYFAAVHACRALLASRGVEPRSHRGLRSLVSLHFVKPGTLPADVARSLSDLQEAREGSDYIATFTVSREEAERLAQACDAIMAAVEPLLGRPGPTSG